MKLWWKRGISNLLINWNFPDEWHHRHTKTFSFNWQFSSTFYAHCQFKKNVVFFKKFQQLLLIFPWQWNTHFGAPLNNFYPPLQHTMGTFSSIAFLCFTISNLSWLPNNPNNRKLYPFFWYPIFFTHINDDQKKLLISTLSLGNLNKFTAVIKWERNLHSRQCVQIRWSINKTSSSSMTSNNDAGKKNQHNFCTKSMRKSKETLNLA